MRRKTAVWIFPVTNWRNINWEDLDKAKNKNFKRTTESLQLAAQDNSIMTNYSKVKIENMQKISKCR